MRQLPIYVLFSGPPDHESGRFVEVENSRGQSVNAGQWEPLKGGYWRLGPFMPIPDRPLGLRQRFIRAIQVIITGR